MNASFHRWMADATRLTRAGDLQAATATIQAALRGAAAAPPPGDADVIDVEARDVTARGVTASAITAPAVTAPHVKAHGSDTCVAEHADVDTGSALVEPAPLPAGQFISGRHTDATGSRDYKLYVPPAHHGQPLPLVVMLHGCTQDPDDFAAGTRMNEAALERGFFVLYPAQDRHANPSRCWSWFKHNHQRRGRGEPALLAAMTRDVAARYPIDPQRVYAAGLSAGGAMAAILGDAYPDLFAAIGVHSGLPAGAARDLPSALTAMKMGAAGVADATTGRMPPTIVFHGDRDGTVHPANGAHAVAASAAGARPEVLHGQSGNGRAYTRSDYRGADGRVVAEHWVVHGAGHAWSGGSARGSYTDANGPDATEEMLRFFFASPLGAVR